MTMLKTSLRNLLAHKGRMLLSVIAVLISVSFVSGTLFYSDTANSDARSASRTGLPDVAVALASKDGGSQPLTVSSEDVQRLKEVTDAARAVGRVTTESVSFITASHQVLNASGRPVTATTWDSVSRNAPVVSKGRAPRDASDAVLDTETAAAGDVEIGDTLRVVGPFGTSVVEITGFTGVDEGQTPPSAVYLQPRTAQRTLLGDTGRYTHIALTAAPGTTPEQLAQRVKEFAERPYETKTVNEAAEERRETLAGGVAVMKYVLLGFAGLSLLVGAFLIVNTFSMLVAQRTREVGLLRAVGASRRQIGRAVLFEAVFLGATGSLMGVAVGLGLAVILLEATGTESAVVVRPGTLLLSLGVGIIVTAGSAYLPARRASRVSPMAALRDHGISEGDAHGRGRAWIGGLLTAAGAASLVGAGLAERSEPGAILLALGVVVTLIGFIIWTPVLARLLIRLVSLAVLRPFGAVGRLAERNALRDPRRTGATAAALLIGLSLVTGLSVTGSSMVASVEEQLDNSTGTDFVIEPPTGQLINAEAERAVKSVDGLKTVTDRKRLTVTLVTPGGKKTRSSLIAADTSYLRDLHVATVAGRMTDAYGVGGMSVDENFAKKHGLDVGSALQVGLAEGVTTQLTVKAVTVESPFDRGAMYTGLPNLLNSVPAGQVPANDAMYATAEDGQAARAYSGLKKELAAYPHIRVRDISDYKKSMQDQVSEVLTMVYGLLALAIVVAALGVVNTLALSVAERSREVGLLRAVGMSRVQIRRMIRLESVVVSVFGALIGVGLGLAWGVTSHELLALSGFELLDVSWETIATVMTGSVLVGLLAALVPGRRASGMDILTAIKKD
ncbi:MULTISPECIES: ABC transporter permease [Streptomyces]|uniref:ABC transporter permease n=1 Tax=Streptomyces heilongjiangensis TaxID=945052 RepID=A0ABW1BAV2_9ACTN|nr:MULTISPECIES: FtsX-like permease family protein [Streptomyces]MDC2951153.1 FtsX-like permease family protein [Streptomyces heilongjiangensis]